ncbi:MAG: PAP2 superfamily protein [Candidatus Nanosalina sp. J07AB43]|nr:MAG: PAP2 superfamily protein [Candidatus Nanosalina sp. J07AB43]
MCLTLLAAYYASAPEAVVNLGGFAVISSIIFGAANHFSKVSIHTGAMTFAAGAFITQIPSLTFTGLLLSIPVGWSRVRLDCHTRKQVIQGGMLGLACGVAASFI